MVTQRRTLGTGLIVVVVLLLGALALQVGGVGGLQHAAAKPKPRPLPVGSFKDKAQFKVWCELMGGTFVDSATQTACLEDSGVTVCDKNGQNCLSYPDPGLPPLIRPTPANQGTGSTHTGAVDGSAGAPSPTPGGTLMTLLGATPVSGDSRGNPGGPPPLATPAA